MATPSRSASLVPALAAYGALTLTFDIVPVLVPPTTEWYGVALSSGAWLYVMIDLGFGMAAFWYGTRSIRRRRLLVLGLSAVAIGNLAVAGAPDFVTHLAARTFVGFAMGAVVAGAMGLVVDGTNVPRRVGALTAVMPAASVLMPVAGWITESYGWRATQVALAAMALGGAGHHLPDAGPWTLGTGGPPGSPVQPDGHDRDRVGSVLGDRVHGAVGVRGRLRRGSHRWDRHAERYRAGVERCSRFRSSRTGREAILRGSPPRPSGGPRGMWGIGSMAGGDP